MCCIVLFYTFCLNFRLLELVPTGSSGVRRIIGGEDADEIKYQYIVRLQYQIIFVKDSIIHILKRKHGCTAAVLTPIWSLTAAHCILRDGSVNAQLENNITIRRVIIHGSQKRMTICKVIHTITHPAYKMRTFDLSNDIGLIRHEPITLKEYARVSGLDYLTMVGQEVTLTGYGITNTTVVSGFGNPKFIEISSDATTLGMPLQFLNAVVVHCDNNAVGTLSESLKGGMCIARPCGKQSGICPGDSGGPLLHPSGVVGVNSFGSIEATKFCILKPHPAFYDPAEFTPTSPYIDWISRTIINEVPKRKSTMHEHPKTGDKKDENAAGGTLLNGH